MSRRSILERYRRCFAAAGVLAGLLLASPAFADMRCGSQLISEGDSVVRLLEVCGEPAVRNTGNTGFTEWVYNFGPAEFMTKVLIRNDQVVGFETLGKGYPQETEPRSESAVEP